jgi:hypothetical protein
LAIVRYESGKTGARMESDWGKRRQFGG